MKKNALFLILLSLLLIVVGCCRPCGPKPRPRWKRVPPRRVIIIKAAVKRVIIEKTYCENKNHYTKSIMSG
ncbi:MAG: hypothetical protein K8R67_19035 [Desulfobacteraceae bacterium]|nr:hypothetical protein [Desulfobacteraceae bacterium]